MSLPPTALTILLTNLQALLAASITPIILSRESSKPDLPSSVKVLSTGYTDKVAVTAALKEQKVEVVISILGRSALDLQVGLAEAAKDAGVQLFFPTEFGFPTAGHTEGYQAQKDRLASKVLRGSLGIVPDLSIQNKSMNSSRLFVSL